MRLLIDTCKTRGAPATTGMAPVVLSTIADATEKANMIQAVENVSAEPMPVARPYILDGTRMLLVRHVSWTSKYQILWK